MQVSFQLNSPATSRLIEKDNWYLLGEGVGHRTNLEIVEKINIPSPPYNRTLVVQPAVTQITESVILAHIIKTILCVNIFY
jgi:hypothetical protein